MNKLFAIISIALLFSMVALTSVEAQCPKNRTTSGVVPYDSLHYTLPAKTRFNIKLADPINSGSYRTGDIVKFTVLENVYGIYEKKEKNPKPVPTSATSTPSESKPADEPADDMREGELMVVIPKDAQGFGRVNFSRPRSTFYFRGKALIFFAPEYVLLDDGRCIEVNIPRQNELLFPPENVKNCKYVLQNVTRPAGTNVATQTGSKGLIDANAKPKNDNQVFDKCIAGRRTQIPFAKGIVAGVAAGGLALIGKEGTKTIGGLTLVETASSDDGVGALLSGNEAEIGNSIIMEVEISAENGIKGYTKVEKKKKEDKD